MYVYAVKMHIAIMSLHIQTEPAMGEIQHKPHL